MQQIVFKRKFSVLLDAVKTEKVQHLEENVQPIKNIIIENEKFQYHRQFIIIIIIKVLSLHVKFS